MDGLTYRAVAHARGHAPQSDEIEVRDDGAGPVLVRWAARLGSEPSGAELAAITITDRDAAQRDGGLSQAIKAQLAVSFRLVNGRWPNAVEARDLRGDFVTAWKALA